VTGGAWMMQRVKISKKQQFTIPSQFRKNSNIEEGSEVLIETQDNEFIIHPIVSDTIKEGYGLFGKETLDSREVKMFAEISRVISKV
jgi:AbrB family looped-hinge helix DNA binding protein